MLQTSLKTPHVPISSPVPKKAGIGFASARVITLHRRQQYIRPNGAALVKRAFNITLASVMLFCLAPLFVVVAFFVSMDGGSAFFGHKRVGRNGKLFDCYKFRSMHPNADKILAKHLRDNAAARGEWMRFQKLKNDIRITKLGRFLRRSSIDELPQLINVLKGDMSFVGPRPCTPEQENFYAKDFRYYLSVQPGITGPWQVGGRNHLSFAQRVAIESAYIRSWSLAADMAILAKTVPTIFRKDEAF